MIWNKIAQFILKNRLLLLLLLAATTALMSFFAAQVKITNEFNKSIPITNPKYLAYMDFKKKFGEDGNVMVVGFKTDKIFLKDFFNQIQNLCDSIKKIEAVEDVLANR